MTSNRKHLRHTILTTLSLLLLLSGLLSAGCTYTDEPKYKRVPIRVWLKRLGSTQQTTVDRAVEAISSMGQPAVSYLLKDYKKADDDRRYLILQIMADIGPGAEEAMPMLMENLDGIDEKTIGLSGEVLGAIGPPAAPALEKMAMLLRSSDYTTQVGLLHGIGGIGKAAGENPKVLQRVVEAAERDQTRTAAIQALANMGPKAVEKMVEWIQTGTRGQKIAALSVLSEAGEDAAYAMPALRDVFKSNDEQLRIAAIRALGQAGPKAVEMLDDLVSWLKDDRKDVRTELINAITAIGPIEAGDRMIEAMKNKNPRIREGAVQVVGRWEEVREKAKSILIARMSDYDVYVQKAAIAAMTDMGKEVVPTMISLLNSKNVQTLFAASRVLGNLRHESRAAIPRLRELTQHKDSLVREEAEKALREIE